MKQMEFLVPIKEGRTTKGNLPTLSDEEIDVDDSNIFHSTMDEEDNGSEIDDEVVGGAIAFTEKRPTSEKDTRKQKKRKEQDKEELLLSLMQKKKKKLRGKMNRHEWVFSLLSCHGLML